ncbi:MAG: hypothetical protein LIO62_09285 [Clostridiales bacterium]|nr:hypothetical protein [Clostridiales bacterium]
MKKATIKFLSVLLVLIMCFTSVPLYAFASDNVKITLTAEDLKDDAAAVIETALKEAKKNATDSKIYKIYVPSGKYYLKSGLHIYSNTYLYLQDDTELVKDFTDGTMLKCGVKSETNYGYNGYKNIKVSGGIWNNNYCFESCCMRFAHCNNLKITNLTIKNIYDSHHLEIAAANNVKISNCTFKNYKRKNNTSGEAIQIDILHSEAHFPSYGEYDDTPCKNITVDSCNFISVFSGVGTRSGVIGSYFTNIKITNNYFEKISDKAIACFNYKDSLISGNVIKEATVGIFFEYYPAKNLTSKLYMPNDTSKDVKIKTNCNTVISNNEITVKKKSDYSTSTGMNIVGGVLDKKTAKSSGLKAGNYVVSNITVKNNTIKTKSASSRGMIMTYVKNSKISGNTITASVKSNSKISAISMTSCTSNIIKNNTITGKFYYGIANFSGCSKNELRKNTISKINGYGIYASPDVKVKIYANNKVSKSAKNNIYVNKKSYKLYSDSTKIKSLKVTSGKNIKITWNKVDTASGYTILRSTSKNGSYTIIASVSGKKTTSYVDKTAESKVKYYYIVAPYKTKSTATFIGKLSSSKSIKK